MKLGFIGAGNMGKALMEAMKNNDILSSTSTTGNNLNVVKNSEIVFICVKPNDVKEVLLEIKDSLTDQIIVSIAAGISMGFIKDTLGYEKMVRVMPNMPCIIGKMAAGYCIGDIDDSEKSQIESLLNQAGLAIEVKEELLDAVVGVSGSGPAFLARYIEFMIKGGVKEGLDRETSKKLAIQTVIGTGEILKKMQPDELIKKISSPNGATIEGLKHLDIEKQVLETISAATRRSRGLG